MGKHTAYRDVEKALLEAIYLDNETFVLSSLDSWNDAYLIYNEAQKQTKYLHQLTRSLETNIHFHKGRALFLEPRNLRNLGMSDHEVKVARNTYKLFKGVEGLIGSFFGKPTDIVKLTDYEIEQL